jgi:hypothetical protein
MSISPSPAWQVVCDGALFGLHPTLESAEAEAAVWLSYGPYATSIIPCTRYKTDPEV